MEPRRRSGLARRLVVVLAVASVLGGCQREKKPQPKEQPQQPTPSLPSTAPAVIVPHASATPLVPALPPTALLDDERNTMQVFEAAAPATVFVTQKQVVRDWSLRALEVPSGTGSGFVWDRQGHIVTNYHVIASRGGGVSYAVSLYNHNTYEARLVGGEPHRDIAVLKIDAPAEELTPIRILPPEARVVVGQKAIAIGNPFGLDHTLTTGVISATGREVEGYGGVSIRDMIQTDASINPGNSGGPLLDSSGRLIGMNTMIYSKSGVSAGIGFAVPVSTIRRIVPQLVQRGYVERAGLGVTLLPDEYAARAGLRGVVIAEVLKGSPAERAGLQGLQQTLGRAVLLGDVIVGIDDIRVQDYDDLFNALDRYRVGERVTVKILRKGKQMSVPLELMEVQ